MAKDEQKSPDQKNPGDDESPEDRKQREEHERKKARRRAFFHNPIVIVFLVLAALLIVVGLVLWWLHARKFEDTDDAFVDTRIVRIAPQVAGIVSRVDVTDNQLVHAGDPLAEIDSRDAQARLDQTESEAAQADAQRAQAVAQIAASESQRDQAQAAARAAQAQADIADRDLARYRALQAVNARAVAQEQLDQAEGNARSAEAQRAGSLAQARAATAQLEAARAQVAGAEGRIRSAAAEVTAARLSLGYTRLAAPVDGHIAQRSVAAGNYVAPGQQMLAIVPLNVWVTANFKETQLALMRPGQAVDVHVDACPDAEIHGRLDSVQFGAGQAFALLPPENATGNYVKVVQRVPVKIVLDRIPVSCPLGPGMSVVPRVRVR